MKAKIEAVKPKTAYVGVSAMFPHITYQGCAPDHTDCTEATCDNEKRASEYWEHKRLDRIKIFGTAKGDACAL